MDEHDWIIDLETGARASPRCSANSRKAKFGYLEMLSEIDPKKIPKISNLGLSFLEIPDQLSNLCLSIKKTSKKRIKYKNKVNISLLLHKSNKKISYLVVMVK